MPTILVTGAAGQMGTMLRPRLARPGRTLRLLDVAPLTAGPGEEVIQASITDLDAMTAACRGADAVIHLGGYAGEESWEAILDVNIGGTYVTFEAARRAGVSRVIFGVSANTRGGWVSLGEARALGYEPQDDAEVYAAEVLARAALDPDDPVFRFLGGEFTLPDKDVPIP